jgi:hypothetical protein
VSRRAEGQIQIGRRVTHFENSLAHLVGNKASICAFSRPRPILPSPNRKPRGCQMTNDFIAEIRLNLESVELAARSCREMSAVDGQALYDRMQVMIELLRSAQDFLVKAGQARQ